MTFKHTENGALGLLGSNRAAIALAVGGTPTGSNGDFALGDIRFVMGFIEITDVDIVSVDPVMVELGKAGANA